jgi:DNA-binding response OmpR family regulator
VRVLLVTSDAPLAGAFSRGLSAEGVRLDIATSGWQALEVSGGTAFDGLVIDVVLPEIDGF